jgi:hypothetical protein
MQDAAATVDSAKGDRDSAVDIGGASRRRVHGRRALFDIILGRRGLRDDQEDLDFQ